ncbi:MAG: AarF/ABC1/UbiB kinase family protein [Patescibacteria group bacterium]
MRYGLVFSSLPSIVHYAVKNDYEKLDRTIYDLFSSMGGVYVKFLQILVSNVNVLKTLSDYERMSVFADSAPSRIDHKALLSTQWSNNQIARLQHIDAEPFSTGSFANVYKATVDGREVVVKVKRPGLDRQLKRDLRIISFVARVIDAFDSQNRYNAGGIAKEYSAGIRREIDYKSEVKNAAMMRSEYEQEPKIVIPETFTDLCTRDIIVQEFVDGVLLSDIMKDSESDPRLTVKRALGSDLNLQLRMLSENFLKRSFSSLPVHGDPHPGNILLMTDNRVAMIDFGLIADPATDVSGYLEYMYEQTHINSGEIRPGKFGVSLLRTHSAGLYRALATVDRALPNIEILAGLEKIMDDRFSANAENVEGIVRQMQGGQTNQIYDAVINPGNNLALSFDMDGMLMLRANNILWTTMIQLGIYRDVAPRAVENSVTNARNSSVLVRNSRSSQEDFDGAMEMIGNWLYAIRESDPVFFRSLSKLFPDRVVAS